MLLSSKPTGYCRRRNSPGKQTRRGDNAHTPPLQGANIDLKGDSGCQVKVYVPNTGKAKPHRWTDDAVVHYDPTDEES